MSCPGERGDAARLLAELAEHGLDGTGIDIQPGLVAWARDTRPGPRLEVGDLRTARLGETYDLVACVGNTLAYLHTEHELTAAFDTIAAHSHPGTLLAVATLADPGSDASSSVALTTSLGSTTVDTTSRWDPTTRTIATTRTWRFAGGRVEHDDMRRRVWHRQTLLDHARTAGFEILPAPSSLTICASAANPIPLRRPTRFDVRNALIRKTSPS